MSRVISPIPIEIKITYSELTGEIRSEVKRAGQIYEMPFPLMVIILGSLLTKYAGDLAMTGVRGDGQQTQPKA